MASGGVMSPGDAGSDPVVTPRGLAPGSARLAIGRRENSHAGGPVGSAPLTRLMRADRPEMRRAVHSWLDRYDTDRPAAVSELVSLLLVVADVPCNTSLDGKDVEGRDPAEVVHDLVAAIAVVASEKGADFMQHWFSSREKGASRVRENFRNFWRELAAGASCQTLLDGLLALLRAWIRAMADCGFRAIRHTATVAGLQFVEGLQVQCCALREFCATAAMQVQDGGAEQAPLSSLAAEVLHTQRCLKDLVVAKDGLAMALLGKRSMDVDPEIRRCCFEAMRCWAKSDPESLLDSRWTRFLYYALSDHDAKTRTVALLALRDVLKSDPTGTPAALVSLAGHVAGRLCDRCRDVDPAAGAAAIQCAAALATRNLLPDDKYDAIVELIWDGDQQRRTEAATFVSRFVLSEDILDYATGAVPSAAMSTNPESVVVAHRRARMLLQFFEEYADGHCVLMDRLVAAFWKRASCLEDWDVLSSMLLPGTEHSVSGEQQSAMIFMMEAIARRASAEVMVSNKIDGPAHASVVLERACKALVPKLPAVLSMCQAEALAVRHTASLCRYLLKHAVSRNGPVVGGAGSVGLMTVATANATAQALKTAYLRQPEPESLEHLAEAMAYLLEVAGSAKQSITELTTGLRTRFLELADQLSSENGDKQNVPLDEEGAASLEKALLVTATRLRILNKAFDVSMCDLSNFGAAVLGLLDDRAAAISSGTRLSGTAAQLAATLLELLSMTLMRQTVQLLQPEPLVGCVAHDAMSEREVQLLPAAADDLCSVCAALMSSDPDQNVRTAAFVSVLSLLAAWWNGTRLAGQHKIKAADAWILPVSPELASSLWTHVGQLLIDANTIPGDIVSLCAVPEPGNMRQASSFSQLFGTLHAVLSTSGKPADDQPEIAVVADADRVQTAVLCSALVATCQHPDVLEGSLPALVLSQALSPREDLQETAWVLLKRLKKDANIFADSAEAFFTVLLQAVRAVHQDAGVGVARDLSYRLLQHVGVGKLTQTMQTALVAALRAGIHAALSGDVENPGLLEALVPWVTKHVVDDSAIEELVAWAAEQIKRSPDVEARACAAGLAEFLEECNKVVTGTRRAGRRDNGATEMGATTAVGKKKRHLTANARGHGGADAPQRKRGK
eukprot:TRINITY_DN17083_c0_g3_i1.p1 TRINITY_DN17083_c0_g3~~TRINITY_DN17083_c0_g3_i1.p1  ORF type:complete len:1131 (+),score=200.78 TRINITY_DN17083_c0_g3_i1:65-3457(+)